MRPRLVDWTFPLLGVILLMLALMWMCSGCAGMVSKGVVESPQVPVHVDAPKVDLQPGAVKVAEGSQATFSVDAIWKGRVDARLQTIEDVVSGIQAKVDSQVSQTVTVGKGNGGLQAAFAGIGAGVLALGALAVYLNARKRRLGQVLNVLVNAIEQEGDDVATKHRVAAQLEALPKAKLTLNRLLLDKGYLGQRGR